MPASAFSRAQLKSNGVLAAAMPAANVVLQKCRLFTRISPFWLL